MAPKLPWFKFWGEAFFGDQDVGRLSDADVGRYLRALWWSWQGDGLPEDPLEVAQLMRCPLADLNNILPFFPVVDGRRRNPRQERERAATLKERDGRSKGGRAAVNNLIPGAKQKSLGSAEKSAEGIAEGSGDAEPKAASRLRASTSSNISVVGDRVQGKGIPDVVLEALALWDEVPGSKLARMGDVKMFLGGAWGVPPTPEILALAITQLAGHGKKEWQSTTLKNWVATAQKQAANAQTEKDVERVILRQTGKTPEPIDEDQSGGMM